jgi:hypothetical protein
MEFSSPECFGWFAEGLRFLRMHELEAKKRRPDHATLAENLGKAENRLQDCVERYPLDALPRYYLGVVRTIQNQAAYAGQLRRQTEIELQPPSRNSSESRSHEKADSPESHLHPEQPDKAKLLEAARLFDSLADCENPQLRIAAQYNLASVFARLDEPKLVDRAIQSLSLLETTDESSMGSLHLGWGRSQEAEATALQIRLLRTWLEARKAVSSPREQAPAEEPTKLPRSLTAFLRTLGRKLRERMGAGAPDHSTARRRFDEILKRIRSASLQESARTELLADFFTKAGFLAYEEAVHARTTDPDLDKLSDAEESLKTALQLKPGWNPAEIYLAKVYAKRKDSRANEQLYSVDGVNSSPIAGAVPEDAVT